MKKMKKMKKNELFFFAKNILEMSSIEQNDEN